MTGFDKADHSGLVKKKVRRSDGVETTVWVSPEEAKSSEQKAGPDDKKPDDKKSAADPSSKTKKPAKDKQTTPSDPHAIPAGGLAIAGIQPEVVSKLRKASKGKRLDAFNALSALGGTPGFSDRMVSKWVGDVFEDSALNLRGAFSAIGAGNIDKDAARLAVSYAKDNGISVDEATQKVKEQLEFGVNTPAAAKSAKAIAQASQAQYDDDFITMHRGVTGEQARLLIEAQKSGKTIDLAVDSVTSFSEDLKIAQAFASNSERNGGTAHGVVISMKVPRSSILMSHRMFSDLKKESEVVVSTGGGFRLEPQHISIINAG